MSLSQPESSEASDDPIPVIYGNVTGNEGILQIDEQGFEDIINRSHLRTSLKAVVEFLEEVNELRQPRLDSEPRSVEEICEELGELFNPPRLVFRQPAGPAVFEPCAWYAPVHYFGANWGIYIREDCVKSILSALLYAIALIGNQ